MKEALLSFLKIGSTSDNIPKLHEAIKFVEQLVSDLDLNIEKYEKNDIPTIVISQRKTLTPKIMLSGHVDVVPPLDSNQFEPYEKDGRIYARGSSDMKGVDVAMIYAYKELISEGNKLDVALMFTSDEEVGSDNGVQYLLNDVGYRPGVVFLPDSGPNWSICVAEKGLWHLKCTTTGVAAHGARPWLGKNAINQLTEAYSWLHDEFITRWGTPTASNDWIPTVNIGMIKGGSAINMVPDSAEMFLDIRIPAEFDPLIIQELVTKEFTSRNLLLTTIHWSSAVNNDPRSGPTKIWQEIAHDHGIQPEIIRSHGGSDAAFFSAKGIPVLMTMPTCSSAHIKDEWVDFEDLMKFKDLIKEWIIANCK